MNKLGPQEFEKLARLRVQKNAVFIFYDERSENDAFYDEAKLVYDRVHPNGCEKIQFECSDNY